MRKFSIAALVAVAALAGSVISATADTGAAGTEWTFSLSVTKVSKPAASHSIGKPAKKEGDYYVAPKKQIFGFPVGSSVDTTALPHCTKTPSDVGRGDDCPEKTRLGSGSANVIVGQNEEEGEKGTELVAEFSAWNQKGKILFVFQTCGKGTGPGMDKECEPAGPPNIVVGTWKDALKAPKLHVPTPEALLKIGVIIIRFELFTKKHTKVVRKNGKRVLKSYVFTPKTCKGSWKTYDKATYIDETSQTIKDKQACTRP